MADIKAVSSWVAKGAARTIWETLTSGATTATGAAPESLPGSMTILTVQFTGTFGSGAVVLEGSNGLTSTGTYTTLTSTTDGSVTATGASMFTVVSPPRFVRPRVSNAAASMDVDVEMLSRTS